MRSNGTLAVSATLHETIFNTPLYASLLTKDAICDRFRDRYGERPSVDKEQPDVLFHIHVFRQKAIVYLVFLHGKPLIHSYGKKSKKKLKLKMMFL